MYPRKWSYLLLLALCVCSCSQSGLRRAVRELDKELDRKEEYVVRFNLRMDSLRLELADAELSDSLRWETAYSLFSAYSYVNVDSTLHYLDVLSRYSTSVELQRRVEACRLRSYGVEQDYDMVLSLLGDLDPDSVSPTFRQRYFGELQRACVLCPGNFSLKKNILRAALEFDALDADVRHRYEGLLLLYDDRYEEALPYFKTSFNLAASDHIRALASYNQATCYNALGDQNRYCQCLAQAAIYDLRVPVSEYQSLLELSYALFEMGDYVAASRYIQVVMGDAIEGNWNSRIQLSATMQTAIFNALDESQDRLRNLMMAFIIVLLLFGGIVLFLLFVALKQNRNLRLLNETVTQMNKRLKDEGRIKENYLFKYMDMSVESIGRLEDYRRRLRQVQKEEGIDSLTALLRTPFSRDNYKEFYANFDATFLNLYPSFIEQVNSLMKPEYSFKADSSLNTDLRILATIRLGFNDSGQIARFLNVPSTSVYSRRSFLRRNSVCNREEFDDKIRQII